MLEHQLEGAQASDVPQEWDLLAWDKSLWPIKTAAPKQKGPAPKAPKATLIAIIALGDERQAAIDFGSGMQYMKIGDTHKKMSLIAIKTNAVELRFLEQTIRLDLP